MLCLGPLLPAADLAFPETVRLGRLLVQDSSLGRGRTHILKWLLACVEPSSQQARAGGNCMPCGVRQSHCGVFHARGGWLPHEHATRDVTSNHCLLLSLDHSGWIN